MRRLKLRGTPSNRRKVFRSAETFIKQAKRGLRSYNQPPPQKDIFFPPLPNSLNGGHQVLSPSNGVRSLKEKRKLQQAQQQHRNKRKSNKENKVKSIKDQNSKFNGVVLGESYEGPRQRLNLIAKESTFAARIPKQRRQKEYYLSKQQKKRPEKPSSLLSEDEEEPNHLSSQQQEANIPRKRCGQKRLLTKLRTTDLEEVRGCKSKCKVLNLKEKIPFGEVALEPPKIMQKKKPYIDKLDSSVKKGQNRWKGKLNFLDQLYETS